MRPDSSHLRALSVVATALALTLTALHVDLPGSTDAPTHAAGLGRASGAEAAPRPASATTVATTTTIEPAAPVTTAAAPPAAPAPTVRAARSPRAARRPVAPAGAEPVVAGPSDVAFSDDMEGFGVTRGWVDGGRYGGWVDVFNGYGWAGIDVDGSKVLAAAPAASTRPDETHAALIRSGATFGDIDVTVRMKTVRQLRTPQPNSWETTWFLWHYADNVHFYYLVLKPNGWELGKEDPAYPGAQRFLATGSSPTFPVGRWNSVRVRQVGNTMAVDVDGVPLASFVDNERPYTGGAIALYSEDAEVRFDDVVVKRP